jgi:hypothetical protein
MTRIRKLHNTWMKDAAYRKAYDALEEEFTVMAAIAKARRRAGLNGKPRHSGARARRKLTKSICRVAREPGIHNHERRLWIPGPHQKGRVPE